MKKLIFALLISANALAMQANLTRLTARLASNSNRQLRQISTNYKNMSIKDLVEKFENSDTNVIMLGLCTAAGVYWGLDNSIRRDNPWPIAAGIILGTTGGLAAGLVWPVSIPAATTLVLYKTFSK